MGFLLHHSIAESAERRPDAEAFRCAGEALTYAELVARARALARRLVAEGVGRRNRVGIYMTKALELPVALYGILEAGGAYVPIDPFLPAARVAAIVEDCGIRHVVTGPSRAGRATALGRAGSLECVVGAAAPEDEVAAGTGPTRFVPWHEIEEEIGRDDGPPLRGPATEHDLAYVMYTSGSTGRPKGLMHTHHSGLAYARLSGRTYGVGPSDRLGNHSPLHFDMSTFEYLTGPLCGATTVILPEEVTAFPARVAELIEAERLTFWYSVPLALIQLLERGGLEERDASSLRWVLFGGEPFPPKHLRRLMELWPRARFSNSYGPAEVNQCTYHHLPRERPPSDGPIPLGRVWEGAEGLVVDGDDEPVAPGKVGELLIRAPTMMRGYWGRPELDRDAFFDRRPFPGFVERFYRTGDLVRERPDGLLEFLGRRDRQVKVRGCRVELDEVESVVAASPGVVEAAAVAVEDGAGGRTIVALARPAAGADPSATELRGRAAERLPPYAVPARVELVEAFPRTGSGKIDRRRLAEGLAGACSGTGTGTGTGEA